MSRTFAYCRVSTVEQTTDNQVQEIANAGLSVNPQRIVTETISGSVQASERPQFARLLDRMEGGDVLVVTKLDRLGRNAMDVRATVEKLASANIQVRCLQLGGIDLTSTGGKLIMQVISAMAEFERDLLVERTQAGMVRAKAAGAPIGRPRSLDEGQTANALEMLSKGLSVASIAKQLGTSRQTVMRVRDSGPTLTAAS